MAKPAGAEDSDSENDTVAPSISDDSTKPVVKNEEQEQEMSELNSVASNAAADPGKYDGVASGCLPLATNTVTDDENICREIGAGASTLIRNGLVTYKIDLLVNGERRVAIRTCAFDSLATVITCALIDDEMFRTQMITRHGSNAMVQFCQMLAAGYLNHHDVVTNRFELLLPILDLTQDSVLLSADCNVVGLAARLLCDVPSAVERVRCWTLGCRAADRDLPSVTVVLNWAGGPTELQCAMDEYMAENCHLCNTCNRWSVTTARELNDYLLIETDQLCEEMMQTSFLASLFPTTLTIGHTLYRLAGIIDYKHKNMHYIAHVMRSNTIWETHNDLNQKVSTPPNNFKIFPHLIMYIKQY